MASRELTERIQKILVKYIDVDFDFDDEDEKEDEVWFRFDLPIYFNGEKLRLPHRLKVRECDYFIEARIPIKINYRVDYEELEDTLSSIFELLCLMNAREFLGTFDFDRDDDIISCKHYVDCKNLVPTTGMIEDSIFSPSMLIEKYIPSIEMLLKKDMAPGVAILYANNK